MSPIVFEINEDDIYKDKCCGESYAMFFLVMVKKKNVGLVNILQDQYMLGVTGPTGTVPFWVSVEACIVSAQNLCLAPSYWQIFHMPPAIIQTR